LKSFLSDEDEALKEVLLTFMTSTKESLQFLEQAILEDNFLGIKNSAHKMNPMFKQIKASHISTVLDQLELEDHTIQNINIIFTDLKNKIAILFTLLEKEIN
jgi:HPt (histidine-containing phosphotransfer) domain-containing protein